MDCYLQADQSPMKFSILFLILMTNLSASAQLGKAFTEKKTFSRSTTISQEIQAAPDVVYALLTHAEDFARWNTTVTSLEGTIAVGEKIKLKSTLDSSRIFKLKVKEMIPNQKLIWGDGMGTRTYTLKKTPQGTAFTMHEKIGSFMFPLFAGKIPSFDASFEQFTADLKKEAERNIPK